MNKLLKYTIRGVAVLIGLFLILYVVAYAYVSSNKKSIIKQVTTQISEKLNGTVVVRNVDLSFLRTFPQISVALEKVSIKDTLFEQHKHPFFTADALYARISVWNLITKTDPLTGIRVDNGNLYVYTDSLGYTNNYLLTGKKGPDTSGNKKSKKMVLDEIKLNNFHITVNNVAKNKLLEFEVEKFVCEIRDRDSILRMRTKNQLVIKSFAFNLAKGSYIKNKSLSGNFDVLYNLRNKQLSFNDIDVKIGEHPFVLTGVFALDGNPRFNLKVDARKITIAQGKTYLPEKVALAIGVVDLDRPLDVKVDITGPLTPGDPLVTVDWATTGKSRVSSPFFVFENASFTGGYTNELVPGLPRKDPNSRIRIHNFSGDWEGIPLRSANIYIDDLFTPMINFDLQSDFSLSTLNNLLQNNSLTLNEGRGKLDVVYAGPLVKNSNTNTSLEGTLKINDGLVMYNPRNIAMKNCNGSIVFNKTNVLVKDLRTNVQGNSIIMNGSMLNLLSMLKTNPGKTSLDWNIYSPALNLETLTSLLKKRTKVVAVAKPKSKFGSFTQKLDDMLEQSNVQLDLNADKLMYKRFTATNVKAAIELVEENWTLKQIALQSGGGSMRITGYVHEKNNAAHEVNMKLNIQNADVSKVMYAFNDFGQDGISYQNLRGNLNSDVDIKLDLDRNLSGSPQNLAGVVHFSLKNGALLNYEPIKKLQNFLFKNRNFEEIKFAELKNTLEVKDRDVTINRMEIQSTALTLFVEGIFSMRGNTDLSIQVPLSNLKKRDQEYKPENVGADAKGGTSVYVRGRPGDDGNIKFKYDLFRKFRKDVREKKEKEAEEKDKAKAEGKTQAEQSRE